MLLLSLAPQFKGFLSEHATFALTILAHLALTPSSIELAPFPAPLTAYWALGDLGLPVTFNAAGVLNAEPALFSSSLQVVLPALALNKSNLATKVLAARIVF